MLAIPAATVSGYATGVLNGIPADAVQAGTLTVNLDTDCAWAITVVAYVG